MKYFLLTFNHDWADEHDVPALCVMNETEYENWSKRKLNINAFLGNGGDNFMKKFQGKTGAELVKLRIVKKMEVDESFAKIFNKAELASLSLSDVFDDDNEYEEDDDEDED